MRLPHNAINYTYGSPYLRLPPNVINYTYGSPFLRLPHNAINYTHGSPYLRLPPNVINKGGENRNGPRGYPPLARSTIFANGVEKAN